MHKYPRWVIWGLIWLLIPLLAACDEVATETPSPSAPDNQAVVSQPTRTLGPIVSFTPRFTATPIPSATYTPSVTPVPTDTLVPPTLTATQTPSPTATVEGVIRSTENVNLREGPGTDYRIILSVSPGTELGVLGIQTNSQGQDWYKVAVIDDDGEPRNLWAFAQLIDTNFMSVVGLVTPQPDEDGPARPASTAVPEREDILAYCRQKNVRPPSPDTDDNIFIEWSWYVSRPEYMEDHLDHATYEVRLDGELLEDWEQYATEMTTESGVYIVYWYYPVGKLDAGTHEVEYRLSWDDAITDGYADFGPGTANEVDTGSCTFNVTGAN